MRNFYDSIFFNVPPLRFPGFTDEWKKVTLGEIGTGFNYGLNAPAKEYDGMNKYIRITDIEESTGAYSEADVVSPNGKLSDEYIVNDNDILLARTGASTGKSYLYAPKDGRLYFAGFLIRFNVNKANPYFIYTNLHTRNYWRWVNIMSARSGQPGINSQEYSSYPLYIPSRKEQNKIANLLQLLDERISTQNKIIEKYESLIQAIIYQKKTDGMRVKSWQKTELSKVLQERNEKNIDGYVVYSVSVSQGVVNQIEYLGRSFAAKETTHYNVVKYGDIVYTKSPTGDLPYGIVKRSCIKKSVAVSPLYGVYKPICDSIGVILHFYFMQPSNTFNYLHPLIQKGAKNTINITNERFLKNSIPLPKTENEAICIANTLISIQKKIDIEKKMLRSYEKEKQYLLSKMFI